jgi:hypothetical protein
VDNVKLLLDYCIRFYDRQFITRENANHDILTRFEGFLDDYFASDAPAEKGMPSVQYCADKLLSFGQLFRGLIEEGDRNVPAEAYPAENAGRSQRARIRHEEIHQRNIL